MHDNLGTIIGAGIDTFWLPELPAPVQVLLAMRLVGLPEEFTLDQQHSGKNIVRSPDDQVVSEVGGDFTVEASSARPDWLAGIIVPAVVQFEVAAEGTYTVETIVDEASNLVPIHIVHGAPGDPS